MTRKSARDIRAFKESESPMVCLTAYTAPMARIADQHADLILVGDSLGMVLYNFESTVPVTLDMMINHGRAVMSSTEHAFTVVDMPFGSYQESPEQAFRNASEIMKKTGCGAVKLEGGSEMAETVDFLTTRGIPVIGHIGLQPQSVNSYGGYKVTGKTADETTYLEDSAQKLAESGALAIVIECMEESVAASLTEQIPCPTIGIGASATCDGQILVTEDLLGLTPPPHARFVKKYAALSEIVDEALGSYAEDVRSRAFPDADHVYKSAVRRLKTVK